MSKRVFAILLAVGIALSISSCDYLVEKKTETVTDEEMNMVYFDKSNPPAKKLTVFDVRDNYGSGYADFYYEKGLLKVLQGLVNRDQPKLFLIFTESDERWFQNMIDLGYIEGKEEQLSTIPELLEKYKEYYDGGVMIDDGLSMGALIAIPVASCENLLPVDSILQRELQLDIKVDLTGKFQTNAEGFNWAWDTYKSQLNQKLFIVMHPNLYAGYDGSIDYIVEKKGFPFWINEATATKINGVDPAAEMDTIERIFKESPPLGHVLGFWWHGPDNNFLGIGEMPGVQFTNTAGKIMLVCGFQNISVHSGIVRKSFAQKFVPAPQKLEDKLYVTMLSTDGDALNTWYNNFPEWFDSKNFGSVPMGWGMGVTMIDVAPAIAEYYYNKNDENNEFFVDVSGLSYINPRHLGIGLPKTEADMLWKEFFDYTNVYAKRMDMKALRILTREFQDREMTEKYAKNLKGIESLFPDWGNTFKPKTTLFQANYQVDGVNVFHALNDWENGAQGLIDQIKDINEQRINNGGGPQFAYIFVNLWYYNNMGDMKKVKESVGDDIIFTTPTGLSNAYKKFLEQQ